MTPLDEIHRRIGRNLMRFQEIEFALKFALPYMHPNGGSRGLDALKRFRETIHKKTLGDVIGLLHESVQVPDGFFDHELQETVAARNELVHHLHTVASDLFVGTGTDDLSKYLDDQYRDAYELHFFSRQLHLATLLCLRDSNPASFLKLEAQYPGLTEKLEKAVEAANIVCGEPPDERES